MDNPRELALKSLVKSQAQGSFSNIEINTVISRSSLEKNDISLYTILYMGVIEKKLFLDNVIRQYSSMPMEKIDIEALNALRLGIYQLVFLDRIPDHSAVDESVKIAPKRSKGFVNAILRSFLRNGKKIAYPENEWERVSIESSIPKEIIEIFKASYGEDTAKEICSHHADMHISLRVNTLKSTPEGIYDELSKRGYKPSHSKIAKDIINISGAIGDLADLIESGAVFVQDESSRIASLTLNASRGESVADVCACPGGKTFSVAIDMENTGRILACDLHKNKLSLIEKGAKRLGIDIIEIKEQNAKEYIEEYDSVFDKVLCDVPCSGLGVIFKKPDIKYKQISDIKLLPSVQYDILKNCSKYVKTGGDLVYSTCTLNYEENEANVKKFLSENDSFEAVDFEIGSIKSSEGMYTFLPHITQTDGFFIAKMKRVK